MPGEEPKIIIDTDWKSQAQAEKERLAQRSAAPKPAAPGSPGAAQGAVGADEGPHEVRFEDVVGLLATLVYLRAPGFLRRFHSVSFLDGSGPPWHRPAPQGCDGDE